jgi:hypothetical protein
LAASIASCSVGGSKPGYALNIDATNNVFNLLLPATISSGVIYDSAPNFFALSITFCALFFLSDSFKALLSQRLLFN